MAVPRKLRGALARLPLGTLRVLEPACGRGVYLERFGPGSLGLDKDAATVAALRARGLDALALDLDLPGWSERLASRAFDAAWVCDVLMHVRDPAGFLAELPRALPATAGGAPVLVNEWVLPEPGRLRSLRGLVAQLVPGARRVLSEPTHLRIHRADEVEALLAAAGYRVEGAWPASFRPTPLGRLAARFLRRTWPSRTWLCRAPAR